ncbi:rhodanese-like domain-containing protein [Bdellovibrio sp. HCB2-146]|uniref:rhodanese-like domain-containing protein n=1 Tax=Bdellovibrio sp. HCB2-146 TaxID=3394362 RepID=UPI0039BC2B61
MREITCEELRKSLSQYELVDVRTPEEYVGELGHIEKARLVTLGPDLVDYLKNIPKDTRIAFICRSGARSGQSTLLSEEMGFTESFNLVGGMIRWNELQYEVQRGVSL